MFEKKIECPACQVQWEGKLSVINNTELLVCSNCGLWFVNPGDLIDIDYDEVYKTVEYQEEYFDSLSENWEKLAQFPTFKQFFQLHKATQNSNTLLDVGCGVGRFCRAAYSEGWDVKGIDVSKTAIEKGNKNVPFTMSTCTVEELVEANENYDVVTAFEVLEHLISPHKLLTTVKDVIRQNGKFFCTVPNLESLTVRNSPRKDWAPPIHVLFFTQQALKILLERAGFIDVVTGITWVNIPPSKPGLKLLKYYLKKVVGGRSVPDPLGLWAAGKKP